jgi:tellurite resistance protein TerC
MLTTGSPLLWVSFLVLIGFFLALDLGLFNRKDHQLTAGEALRWVAIWGAMALLFCGFVAWRFGTPKALDFLTGYVLELSLSVDNLFVFVLLFGTFKIPGHLQHRVLFWGIVGALALRATMILGGSVLLSRFAWLIYLFGAFLLVSGIKLLFHKEEEHHPEQSWAFRTLRRIIPATSRIDGHRFTLIENGRRVATPLLLALILIELSDVVFALDSVPAIFGVTLDPFIVFTSNIFAILGLRSIYFVLARLMGRFEYLHFGLSAVLSFIGAKMLLSHWVHIPSGLSLGVVVALLAGSMCYSVWRTSRSRPAVASAQGEPGSRAEERR